MVLNRIRHIIALLLLLPLLSGCSVSIGLAPISSIDYSKVKTVQIEDFPNHAQYVYGPLATILNDRLKDMFIQQARLKLVDHDGDLVINGEITGYNQYNESTDASGYSSMVKLTLTVSVSYINTTDHEQDFDNQTFTASQTYSSTQLLTAVQDDLIPVMVKDITEQIYNSTIASW